jgi:dTDP-4-dehydrorhamnose 3,5-epimerase
LAGLVLLSPDVHGDERGFFVETWRADRWPEAGADAQFVQDNQSRSRRGTVRGMHFQSQPGQAKLLRVARGAVFDVVVDVRSGSPTFGEWEGFELDDRGARQLFVPVGFAHGFQVTSDVADVAYRVSSYYEPATESGFAVDDPDVAIRWPLPRSDWIMSERDAAAPSLAAVAAEIPFSWR